MNKLIILSFSILLASSFSTTKLIAQDNQMTLSPEQSKMILERSIAMIKTQQKDDCKDSEVVECMGISETKCEKVTTEIMNDCTIPLIKKSLKSGNLSEVSAERIEKESTECALKVAVKNSVDAKKFLSCVDESDESSYDEDSIVRELIEES